MSNDKDQSSDNSDENDGNIEWTNRLAKELHKPVRRKFRKRRVFSPGVDVIWAADIADMSMFSKSNNGVKYILCIIDTFSKFGIMIPMKSKTAKETADAFKQLFEKKKLQCNKLWTDKGSEFINHQVKKVLNDYNVKIYTTENEEKSCIVERWIRTMKSIMYRYFTAARTRNYISVLQKMVLKYNNTVNRSIRCTPTQARMSTNYQAVFNSLYPKLKDAPKATFKIGDIVRIERKKGTFEKGFETNFTEELYKISEIRPTNPVTYKLVDLEDEEIIGSFYKENLQKSSQEVYFIEKILRRRVRNGIKEVYVKWSGYSPRFNSWLPEGEVIDTVKRRRAVSR